MNIQTSLSFKDELAEIISQVVQDTTGRMVQIRVDDRLIEDGYLDSFSMINLILEIQKTYGIEIDVTEIDESNFGSVLRIADFIAARR